ncbi:hypothetical protein [Catenuloplanes indicus]|uniref:LTD domain-containing protein n=1 Tax=Catenuloplanes indicus TaxID=137267 RepID=A0AAE4B1H7_9ACTN|nr:hypothetical protein [Catenuloplanes indicus]MDQ0371445.1 hypothetical protein [Catenuloplanes indicus]
MARRPRRHGLALIDPAGPNQGREVLVLGDLASAPATLDGWRIIDRNGRATTLTGTVGPGASALVRLDGADVQLGNRGGYLILLDAAGTQTDAVVCTATDATAHFTRFHR